ncbi:hypothetical protein TR51_10470 [Kitasatospora griseola]|uniref:Uncharacterized protein n=1 Tax=Kitasatospora griseola TaxID=2064 RepID=A0A0D0Q127_KITGR|nr:hypothetical protein [Kitasatospora griseola]KIQ64643.1 hypothetical protein TR51_10470 [Kitasatospora griseola]
MKLAFLGPLYARQGPYACAYVDTSRDLDDPDRAIDLRRRRLESELARQGADMATVGAVVEAVGTDRSLPGRHGQAVFAAHGRLALTEELPVPPARDSARLTLLPDAMPLALQHAPDIPYTAAAVHRFTWPGGAPSGELEADLQAGRWPTARVAPGGRVRRRVPAEEWRQAAAEVAEQLAGLAERTGAEVVVLSGDHWARNTLARDLPKPLRDRTVGIDSDGWNAQPERALLEDELDYLFRGRLSAHDQSGVDRFLARRARRSGAVEGLAATVTALRRGQAEAVLINDPFDLEQRLWVGLAPKQVGCTREELTSLGISSCWEEPADAALIRAIVGTGAELIVVPGDELPLPDGLGALLRYTG